ncbi:MAG: outer membrane lipoprotein carrier protein LolA [Deltaproteobacteria bacterium]|nr:outer membrane lipoprotein carrier protein LolA [Deltaproteobacteria bacterium]
MRIFLVSLVSSLVLATSVTAQSRAFDCDPSKKISLKSAQEIVTRVQDNYAKVKTLQANFLQDSFVASLEVSELSSGQVWFSKPGKMKWLYKSPEEQTFIVRDETLWLYQNRENQLLIDDFRNVLISDLPVAFLMGLGNLSRDFKLTTACQGPEGTVLEFVPLAGDAQDPKQALKLFRLLVSVDYYPKGAKVSDVGGNTTAILLEDRKTNSEIGDSVYASDFPKGADINDRRSKDKA